MLKRLYEGLRRLLIGEEDISINRRSNLEYFPQSADQIKPAYIPIRYIREGERAMQKMFEERKKSRQY